MRAWTISGIMLGFALGGFFDGILLHQILQWHHLLSLVSRVGDLRAQLLWDGYFHGLMYLVAVTAFWGLWRSRTLSYGDRRHLPARLLLGFGAWHILDAVASHWILGIHRVRLDSANPLLWDLAWFAGFGLIPLALAGLLWKPRARRVGPGIDPRIPLALIGSVTAALAAWSLQPASGQRLTTIVFARGADGAAVVEALRTNDARLAWGNPDMSVIVADVPQGRGWNFYRSGALLVAGSGLPGGCAGWVRT